MLKSFFNAIFLVSPILLKPAPIAEWIGFPNNLTRYDGKTSCNSLLVFLLSYHTCLCPSVVAWSDNKDILKLVLPFINVKFALGISFNFSSWLIQTLHIIFLPPTSIIFSQLNRLFHFLKVVSVGILLFNIFISYHLFFPWVFT